MLKPEELTRLRAEALNDADRAEALRQYEALTALGLSYVPGPLLNFILDVRSPGLRASHG